MQCQYYQQYISVKNYTFFYFIFVTYFVLLFFILFCWHPFLDIVLNFTKIERFIKGKDYLNSHSFQGLMQAEKGQKKLKQKKLHYTLFKLSLASLTIRWELRTSRSWLFYINLAKYLYSTYISNQLLNLIKLYTHTHKFLWAFLVKNPNMWFTSFVFDNNFIVIHWNLSGTQN